jgi:midasin (ATPase involved in ribosome maturation)
MKTFLDLNTLGVYNVFDMKGKNNHLVVAYLKDRIIYCVKAGVYVYIPTEFSDPSLQGFVKDLYDHVALTFKLTKCRLTEVKDVEFKDDFEITGLHKCPTSVAPVSLKYLDSFLKGKGVDVAKLTATLTVKKSFRDYSDLLEKSSEARERVEIINKSLGDKTMDTKYKSIAEAIRKGDFVLVYLVGPAGTGKTVLTYHFAKYCGAPLLTFQGSEGVTFDNLVGCSDVKADYGEAEGVMHMETLHSSSSFTVIEGQLLKAYREGYQIVIDEANYMVPGVMSVINSMTDDTPTYEFKGKIIKRHPNFVLYLTSNPGYEGTYLYNPATKSRGVTLLIDKLTKEEFMKRMFNNFPSLSLDFYASLFEFQDLIQDYANKWGESSSICIRHAMNLVKLVTAHTHTYEEFKHSFCIAYLYNGLCMDNDNSAKLQALLKDVDFDTKLKSLYANYDYKVIPDVEPSISFEEIYSSFDTDWAEDSVSSHASSIDDDDFEASFDEEDFR